MLGFRLSLALATPLATRMAVVCKLCRSCRWLLLLLLLLLSSSSSSSLFAGTRGGGGGGGSGIWVLGRVLGVSLRCSIRAARGGHEENKRCGTSTNDIVVYVSSSNENNVLCVYSPPQSSRHSHKRTDVSEGVGVSARGWRLHRLRAA